MTQEVPFKEGAPIPSGIELGVYIPQSRLSNNEIESWGLSTSTGPLTADRIYKLVGIEGRPIAKPNETTHDMLNAAVTDLGYRSNRNFTDPDVVLVSSSFPTGTNHSRRFIDEWQFPATTVHQDIHAACSGFVKGLVALHEAGDRWMGAEVMLAASEKYSPYVRDLREGTKDDPALSQTIFSDGAAVARFRFGQDIKVLTGRNLAMFDKSELIGMPIRMEDVVGPADSEVARATRKTPVIYQDGKAVFGTMIDTIPDFIESLIDESGVDPNGLRVFPHQGSAHIVRSLQKRLPNQQVIMDLEDGNFSSATIPRMLAKADLQKGQRAVLVGFGAGLFASGVVVEFG